MTGRFILRDGGRFDLCSAVLVDVGTLRSEDDPFAGIPGAPSIEHRDETVQEISLKTDRYPFAAFRPRTYAGAPYPLPAEGEWRITVQGELTLRGIARDTEWTGTVRSAGGRIEIALGTVVKWSDFDIAIPQPPSILRFDDHGTVEVRLVAGAISGRR